MSLRINNNVAAINAHRNLLNTTSNLSRSMEKLSSGYQINRAADNPAGLVISEQFRAQIAGLNQAIANSEGSINMIQTAEGSLNEINNLLVSMRELAIHAANEGFNDTAQLEADQAEIDNAIKTIDRIAANTQFGTKKLLDGTKANVATITSANSAGFAVKESNLDTGQHSISATKSSETTATINTTSLGISLNSAVTPYNLTDGIHNISVIQASEGAEKITDSINLVDAWGNGMYLDAAAEAAYIVADGSTALAAAASSAFAGDYSIQMRYQENGESVTGWQTVTVTVASSMTQAEMVTAWNNALANNAELVGKLEATISAGGSLMFQTTNQGTQYSFEVGTMSGPATKWFDFKTQTNDRGVSTNNLRWDINVAKATADGSATIVVTAGEYTSLSALVTELNTQMSAGAAQGTVSGTTGNLVASVYDSNKIKFTLMDEGSDYSLQLVATSDDGLTSARAALGMETDAIAVSGTDALVSFDGYTNTITAVDYKNTLDVTIANKADGEAGRGTIGLTLAEAYQGIDVGNLLLDVTAAKYDVRLDGGPSYAVTAGVDTIVYNADRSQSLKLSIDLTSAGGSETINNTDQSLVFQIGPNVGQTAKIGINNMAASALGRNIAGNMFYSLAEINVTSVQGAQDAQEVIDYVIDEVSTIRGTLGSFQKNTLESNLRNLRIASQNLQASESNIRDTDMAKEMSTFVKNQILVQAGTAMLAQANQVPQAVLSLFG